MRLSIVTTLYYSAPYIREFYERMVAVACKHTDEFEIIFVNDGSPDDSLKISMELHKADPRIRIVDLSRNFGHHKAMMTGLGYANGDEIFLIDCDLEEAPEHFVALHQERLRTESDVVYGVQTSRKGDLFERFSGACFYWVLNSISATRLPVNVLTARLMSKRYVKSLIEHQEAEINILGLWTITGYSQSPLPLEKKSKGKSSYSLSKKFSLFINGLTAFTNRPLYFVFYLGLFISLISALVISYLIVRSYFYGDLLLGWPSTIASIWFIGGLIIFCLGVIGIYIAKIFVETKRRPYTIVRELIERD